MYYFKPPGAVLEAVERRLEFGSRRLD